MASMMVWLQDLGLGWLGEMTGQYFLSGTSQAPGWLEGGVGGVSLSVGVANRPDGQGLSWVGWGEVTGQFFLSGTSQAPGWLEGVGGVLVPVSVTNRLAGRVADQCSFSGTGQALRWWIAQASEWARPSVGWTV